MAFIWLTRFEYLRPRFRCEGIHRSDMPGATTKKSFSPKPLHLPHLPSLRPPPVQPWARISGSLLLSECAKHTLEDLFSNVSAAPYGRLVELTWIQTE